MNPQALVQGTDEWKAARIGLATGSKFYVIMAGDKYAGWKNYKAELLFERLTGVAAETYQSKEMAWGSDSEPLARLFYKLKTHHKVEECGFYKIEGIEAGASPDGLISDDGVLEIKNPNSATHLETLRSGKIPKIYYPQVQAQLWATGRKWADFVSFDSRMPENAKMIIIPVPRDDIYIEKLEKEVTRFLEEVDQEVNFVKTYGREQS